MDGEVTEAGEKEDCEEQRCRPLQKRRSLRTPWREKMQKGRPHSRKNVDHYGVGYNWDWEAGYLRCERKGEWGQRKTTGRYKSYVFLLCLISEHIKKKENAKGLIYR
ncbi:hypothetical protein NDU88_005321 [Pleurodeles waltl]|uniref:Uncharacterized protein n=1 Tax=Pleurodeles waltl TaxID=8319 RepID=A0AAV7SLC5_PLEWA|nr:hypothetical protein NDU88_005321 [Pleurodeles waltl]